ncbi:MAG: SDR family NAD(P)-dependent oxidoreductase [Pseudomonadota bacterium]
MTRRLALITGASAGLGAEFARQYAAKGWDIALTARRADRLQALAETLEQTHAITAITIAQDLAQDAAIDLILEELKAHGRHADALINNAGYGLPGTFFTTSWEDQAKVNRVLWTAPLELMHKLLPGMTARNYGRIINVSSVLGYTSGAGGQTLYGPIKAALIRVSEAVHAEARDASHNINVTALCPGLTNTEFHDVAGTRERTDQAPDWMWMQPGPVVEAGIEAVERGQPVIVPGGVNKGITTLAKLLPDPLGRLAMREQSKRWHGED